MRDAIAYEATARRQYQTTQDNLEARLTAIISADPFLTVSQCWATIPGSHSLAIAALHVATHGMASELTATKFKATVGSHPRISQSGADLQSEAARQGFRPAKKYLYLWAMNLIRDNDNAVSEAFASAKDRGSQHAMAAARSQLCLILSALSRNRQAYDPSRR